MLIQEVNPVVLETINRQQSIIVLDHSIGACTIPLIRILSMVKNCFVVDNSDRVLPISSNDRTPWYVGAIVKIEPTGNAFATSCWVDSGTITEVLEGKGPATEEKFGIGKSRNRELEEAIRLAYVESMNRMCHSNGPTLYSSPGLFPPNLRQAIQSQTPPDYGIQFNGPLAEGKPFPHRAPLDAMWKRAFNQQQQPIVQQPMPDQFSKLASFGPGSYTNKNQTPQQSTPESIPSDLVQTIDVQAIPVQPQQAPPRRPAASHINGMVNAILASGNTHGVIATKPNDAIGAFVNGDGDVIITYDDGSFSPPIKPEALSIDPYELDMTMQGPIGRDSFIPVQILRSPEPDPE